MFASTENTPEVSGTSETLNQVSVRHVDDFFDMPSGNQLWLAMKPVDILGHFFRNILDRTEQLRIEHNAAIVDFKNKGYFTRLSLLFRGWQAPPAPSIHDQLDELKERCNALLSEWINLRIHLNLEPSRKYEPEVVKAKIETVLNLLNISSETIA